MFVMNIVITDRRKYLKQKIKSMNLESAPQEFDPWFSQCASEEPSFYHNNTFIDSFYQPIIFFKLKTFYCRVEISGFDFDDEPMAPKLTPRRTPGSLAPKGSAKKKTTNFENILASVRRQKKLEAREKSRNRKDK